MISLVHHLALLFHLNRQQDLVLWDEDLATPTLKLTSSAWVGWHEEDPRPDEIADRWRRGKYRGRQLPAADSVRCRGSFARSAAHWPLSLD
ncbi:hypothetical protein J2X01_003595 [Arthrobacter ginsengisoli]|uniref:Uncharacterized protein n=1 Tax=Arthrobacter ginsengisoli TaxID=1356565 RepID=A0ABU1UGH9_9MICC|nr:hypothetical protein [Arthrobacter ginsengisoli]MDR7084287.1 hypothetical protein [Arthrobacter ginsengisoli]